MWWLSSGVNIGKSNILNGIIDCHSHILPGVDDGVETMAETLSILHIMESCGVKKVWLTPHVMEDMPNETSFLQNRFRELKNYYKGDIEIALAAEYMIDNTLDKRLEENDILALEEGKRYLLIETSYFSKPIDMINMLRKICSKGYYPLLAHPERYEYMQMDEYKMLKNNNVFFQLNIPSLERLYSDFVRSKAEKLLKLGMYDMLGFDTHSIEHYKSFLNSTIRYRDFVRLKNGSLL